MARILWSAEFHPNCSATAMPVALELQRRGHEIVVVCPSNAESRFSPLDFGVRRNVRVPAYDFSVPGTVPGGSGEASAEERYRRWWRQLVAQQLDDTMELLHAEHFDAVFSGGCMQLCGQGFAALKTGVPWVSYIDFLVGNPTTREDGFGELWNAWRASLGVPPEGRPHSESFWYPFSSDLTLLLVDRALADPGATMPGYVHLAGATYWEPAINADVPSWVECVGKERPAVLVSTSSLWQNDVRLITATAEALAGCDVDVVVTMAAKHDLPALPNNVIVDGYVPHELLMERVSVVVCSSGLGTVTRALRAGVPIVAVPRSGDGRHVSDAVVRLGAGLALQPEPLTAVSLGDAVSRLLTDPRFATAARASARRGVDDGAPAEAASLIEALIR